MAWITIALTVLTFLGTQGNNALVEHRRSKSQKVQLMEKMCFVKDDCEALKKYLIGHDKGKDKKTSSGGVSGASEEVIEDHEIRITGVDEIKEMK